MILHQFIPDRSYVDDAQQLIRDHGPLAAREAGVRARQSRVVGNVAHFCKWRTIARLIRLLDTANESETLH